MTFYITCLFSYAGLHLPDLEVDDIAKEVQGFEARFYRLVFMLQSEMLRNQIPMVNIRHSLTLLPVAIRTEHYSFLNDWYDRIRKAEDIEDLFGRLNHYWTYLEYSLLNHIIESFSSIVSNVLKDSMTKYIEDIECFKKRTTAGQLLEVGLGCLRREPPPGFSRLVAKLKRKASECTLKELDQYRHKICLEFNLPTFIMMLASFDEGSLCINWHVPLSYVHCFKFASSAVLRRISSELFYFQVDDDSSGKCITD